ncbi:MAG: hypothetical protein IPP78_14550 [Holophagaceae bacterium]|nr:hypothetical protein [Holophagaceae bacterium]
MAGLGRYIAGLGALSALVISAGCDNKEGTIPNVPPTGAQTPAAILPHLQYLAAWKNYKHLILIAPISPDVVFPSAWWFHNHAKQLGISLTPEELQVLGISKLASRLDDLPRAPEEGYGIEDARMAFNAGIYRLIKGLPVKVWAEMKVSKVSMNPGNNRVMDVMLTYNNHPMIQVSCIKKVDAGGGGEFYGVANIWYQVRPETVK